MPGCVVSFCKNYSRKSNKSCGITFHRFPQDKLRVQKWVEFVRLERRDQFWLPNDSSRICSDHFAKEMFYTTKNGLRKLNKTAVPSEKVIESPNYEQATDSDFYENGLARVKVIQSQNIEIDTKSDFGLARVKVFQGPNATLFSNSDLLRVDDTSDNDIQVQNAELPCDQKEPISDHEVDISDLNSIFDTPRKHYLKIRLRKETMKKRKLMAEVKLLKQKNKRLTKKCDSIKEVVNKLKKRKFLKEDQYTELKLKAEAADFQERLYTKSKVKYPPGYKKKFPPALRKFALTLNYYSAAAYRYVRRTFKNLLPHPRTLSKWYQSVDSEPGFTAQSFKTLGQKREQRQNKLICCLVVDEMAIRHQCIWNGRKTEGLVNLGPGLDDKNEIATQAYVFMVVSMEENWKLPVGYFFVNGLSGEDRKRLILLCLTNLHDVGVDVVALTFDGCSSNLAAANLMGCKLDDVNNMKTTFKHPSCDSEVAIILDPCHMLKLVRNTFEAKRIIYDKDGKMVKWQYLINLEKLQQNDRLNFANKLTPQHLNFRNQVMKVRFAVQLLSSSVAKALRLCDELLNSSLFKDSDATVHFISTFNDLFDVLNSRTINKYGFKKPICKQNANDILTFFDEATEYIKSLTIQEKLKNRRNEVLVTKKQLVCSRNKTGFIGFLVCIQSLKHLYTSLVESGRLHYLSTYRLSQDHIELFFSLMRRHGGYNNNPNVRQFKGIYKKACSHIELKDYNSGNCIPLDNYPILTCSSGVDTINRTSQRIRVEEEFAELENTFKEEDCQYKSNVDILVSLLSNKYMSVSVEQIVGYIAGWVARKLVSSIKCETCVDALFSKQKLWFHKLITIKNMGGLCFPTEDLYIVCLKCEQVITDHIKTQGEYFQSEEVMKQLKIKTLKCFLYSDVFGSLQDHSLQQPVTSNHRLHLLIAIIDKYLLVKTHHLHAINNNLKKNANKRQKFTKLILFDGN